MTSKRIVICILAAALSTPAFAQAGVRVEGDAVLVADGLITFHVPAGWKKNDSADDQFTVISGRDASPSNSYPSAGCRIRLLQGAPSGALTQAHVNARVLAMELPTVAKARENGSLRMYSKEQRVGDVALIRLVIADSDAYSDNRQLMIVQGGQLIGLHADCNTSFPEKAEDKRDIDAFLGSIAIKRPS